MRFRRPVIRTASTPAWLGPFFHCASALPALTRAARPAAIRLATLASARIRTSTRLNARRIFGHVLGPSEQRAFTHAVVGNFYDFICEVGYSGAATADQVRQLIAHVDGLAEYRSARVPGRGAILVTAHLGSFEAGLAALAGEEQHIRVVYRKDAAPAFEQARSRLRKRLGVIEAPIDDGWTSWLSLRDALRRNEVVVMQGDRALPGQRSQAVPILHGHVRLPTGPVRLARITGSPIIPVFAPRQTDGRYRILLGTPIEPAAMDASQDAADGPRELARFAQALSEVIANYPAQWLILEPAFAEDSSHGG